MSNDEHLGATPATDCSAAPPVAAPGASIAEDNVFVHALSALTKSSVLVPWTPEEQAFIDCVDAKLAQRYEAGKADQTALLKECLDRGQAEFNRKWTEQKDRADAAEASLARLVEGVEKLRAEAPEYMKATPNGNHYRDGYKDALHDVRSIIAILPAKADKPTEGDGHA